MDVILASASPRRRELLAEIYPDFRVVTAEVDERAIEKRITCEYKRATMLEGDMPGLARVLCCRLARAKAEAVYNKLGKPADTLLIGADTAVAVSDEILGKPIDRNDAVRMLRKESKMPQQVISGVCLIKDGRARVFSEISRVYFKPLDEAQEARIQSYCDTNEPYDKAGAYGIQAGADSLIAHYDGSYSNIVGFPVEKVKEELEKFFFGIEPLMEFKL